MPYPYNNAGITLQQLFGIGAYNCSFVKDMIMWDIRPLYKWNIL